MSQGPQQPTQRPIPQPQQNHGGNLPPQNGQDSELLLRVKPWTLPSIEIILEGNTAPQE